MFYCCIIGCSLLLIFLYFFTVEHNPTLGSHIGRLVGSFQPAIHDQPLAAANIVENGFKG